MGTILGPKYIPYTYMEPLGRVLCQAFFALLRPRFGLPLIVPNTETAPNRDAPGLETLHPNPPCPPLNNKYVALAV